MLLLNCVLFESVLLLGHVLTSRAGMQKCLGAITASIKQNWANCTRVSQVCVYGDTKVLKQITDYTPGADIVQWYQISCSSYWKLVFHFHVLTPRGGMQKFLEVITA